MVKDYYKELDKEFNKNIKEVNDLYKRIKNARKEYTHFRYSGYLNYFERLDKDFLIKRDGK